jgi:hypothetical protein
MTSDSFEMGLPDKIDLQHTGADLVITRRWFGLQTLMMTAFVIFWDGFLFFWYSKAVPGGDMMVVLFPLLHVGVGVWLTYYTLAGYVNKTIVRINYEKISVRHRPLPYWGYKTVQSGDIKQLYSKEKISRSSNKRSVTYEVHALTHNGKSIKLVSYMESSEQALFVEQEIEKYLGIKDKPVRGEISR